LCLVIVLSGCTSTSAGSAATEPAKAAVVKFLDAMKRGDEAAASGMLTSVARAKTEEVGISVAPPVPDTATYTVRDCEMVSEANDLAHVATTWADVDETGAPTSENIVWAVRLDPEGWRVVGMAMKIFEDMPPLLLNFEDPQDMIAKQEMVAEELTQDVFVNVYRSRARYVATARVRTYLYRIAHNLWIDHLRRRRRHFSLDAGDDEDGPRFGDSFAAPAIHDGAARDVRIRDRVQQALELLPAGQREVFVLANNHGMKYHDIAGVLGIPEGTVKSRMHNAVRALRDELADLLEDAS
jgi:RNA polymerase sigma-70 factor (ECF subfamily)